MKRHAFAREFKKGQEKRYSPADAKYYVGKHGEVVREMPKDGLTKKERREMRKKNKEAKSAVSS